MSGPRRDIEPTAKIGHSFLDVHQTEAPTLCEGSPARLKADPVIHYVNLDLAVFTVHGEVQPLCVCMLHGILN